MYRVHSSIKLLTFSINLTYFSTFPLQDEIVETCRNNIECLQAVLKGPITSIDVKQVTGKSKKSSKNKNSPHSLTIILLEKECRCAKIARFIARVFDFLLDLTNMLTNFVLYQYFLNVLYSFRDLVGSMAPSLQNVLMKIAEMLV